MVDLFISQPLKPSDKTMTGGLQGRGRERVMKGAAHTGQIEIILNEVFMYITEIVVAR